LEESEEHLHSIPYSMEDTKQLPPGMRDPARRVPTNSGIKDRVTIEKYGAETNGEYSLIRCWTSPGGGTPIRKCVSIKPYYSLGASS
jgi:hypothetical protein